VKTSVECDTETFVSSTWNWYITFLNIHAFLLNWHPTVHLSLRCIYKDVFSVCFWYFEFTTWRLYLCSWIKH
jgi:hypothetical protein